MIDGINCRVHGDSLQNLMHCNKLDFVEYANRLEAKYKGLIITIYRETQLCYLRGSIHKFKNEGLHNADQFGYNDFQKALLKLTDELGVSSSDLYVVRFEIGVNIPLPFPVSLYLNTITLINNRIPIKKGVGLYVEYGQYEIKMYSKSKQYSQFKNDNILRVEIAYLKKQKLTQDLGKITTLDEVLNPAIWNRMAELLQKLLTKITFFDYSEIVTDKLTQKEALIFYEWSNPVRILQEENRVKKHRLKKQAYNIYLKYSMNKKAEELILLSDKILKEILDFRIISETFLHII